MNYFCVFVSIILYRLFYCHAGTGPGQIWCHQYLKPFRCVCLYFIVFVPFSLDIIFYLCIGVFVCFCICAFVFLYLCICTYVFICAFVFLYLCISFFVFVHLYFLYLCICIFVFVHLYFCNCSALVAGGLARIGYQQNFKASQAAPRTFQTRVKMLWNNVKLKDHCIWNAVII